MRSLDELTEMLSDLEGRAEALRSDIRTLQLESVQVPAYVTAPVALATSEQIDAAAALEGA